MSGKRVARGVRKLGKERYEFRAMRSGRTISNVVRASSDAEAKRKHRQWLTDIDSGRVAPTGDSLASVLDRWLALKKTQDLSPTTLALYEGIVEKHIKPALGATPVNRVTTLRLDELYGQLLAAGVGRNTVHKVHLVLNGCLGQAVRWSLIPMNPAEHAQPPKPRAPQTAERTATLDQVRKLYVEAEASDPDFAPCIRLAAATGARRGELAALQWKDVDFEDRSIVIRQAVVRTDGGLILKAPKNGRTRKVAVDDETLRILKKHHAALAERSLKAGTPLSDDAFLFSARPGNAQPLRPETITHRFNKLATEIGAPALTLHGLRHFHVSQLIGAGEDVVTVSARVGHSRPSITTDIYSHVLPERDRQVSDRVGEILSEAL